MGLCRTQAQSAGRAEAPSLARNRRPIHLRRPWRRPRGRSSAIAPASARRDTTDDFIQDLRQRVIGVPEISTDGLHYYKPAIRDAFGKRATHGVINKTYSVTHLNVTEASRRYSPAASSSRRAAGGNGRARTDFDKLCGTAKSDAAHGLKAVRPIEQRLQQKDRLPPWRLWASTSRSTICCRTHEALRMTPAMALGITDRVWTIGELIEAALKAVPTQADADAGAAPRKLPGNPRRPV